MSEDAPIEIDHDRERRCGFPEVIFGAGKTTSDIVTAAEAIWSNVRAVFSTSHTAVAFGINGLFMKSPKRRPHRPENNRIDRNAPFDYARECNMRSHMADRKW